jgi:hypothetical protein
MRRYRKGSRVGDTSRYISAHILHQGNSCPPRYTCGIPIHNAMSINKTANDPSIGKQISNYHRIRHNANPQHADHPARAAEPLVSGYGGLLGSFYVCAGGHAGYGGAALCVEVFGSEFFPSLLYVPGSWYTKTELAKRVALFHTTAPLGSAFGEYLQAAVYKTLDGANGLAGWRWLYIICGVSYHFIPLVGDSL